MSTYSDISKRIGWHAGVFEPWPTKEECLELLKQVKEGDLNAFEKVFKIYRYAECTPGTINLSGIITDAFCIGLAKWS